MPYTTIRDNRLNGKVGDFLKETITEDSSVSIVSAYFTIYAYYQLKENLDKIKELRFLFGEPTFIKAIDTSILLIKKSQNQKKLIFFTYHDNLKSNKLNSDTTHREKQIDQLVYQLYELTEEEIALVDK